VRSLAITIARAGARPPAPRPGETLASSDELREWLSSGEIVKHLFRYREARLLTYRMRVLGRPLFLSALVRALGRGRCRIQDELGATRDITTALLARWSWQWVADRCRRRAFVRHVERQVAALENQVNQVNQVAAPVPIVSFDPLAPSAYLRADISYRLQAGGSVGHIAGVLNSFRRLAAPPIFITTDEVPTLDRGIETHLIDPPEAFWNFRELPALALNEAFFAGACKALSDRPVSFIYQRYSVNSFAGVRLARTRHVPLVTEYNGPEVWVSRHWGEPLEHERLTERIERLNLAAADMIVVVSRALADELSARGFDRQKILVNPNGVDPDRYSPAIDGSAVRARYGLEGADVIGFIGTFGPWHGADVLMRAFARLVAGRRDRRGTVRLLMIGEGPGLRQVRRIMSEAAIEDLCVFTGLVPQEEGPRYLAACDVLVSPHVPNPDGSPFFGSPTKLFEYMAMGKGIVASDLDQIGEVLEHGRTAWLVAPGDVADLARGLETLAADPALRNRLGAEARTRVLAEHTWHQHTCRTLHRLQELTSSTDAKPQRAVVQ
jgi:glycosyltransferase involved in cell wall biosynthesis